MGPFDSRKPGRSPEGIEVVQAVYVPLFVVDATESL
jgi:hypothetical protein